MTLSPDQHQAAELLGQGHKQKDAARTRLDDLVDEEHATVDKSKTPHIYRLVEPVVSHRDH